MDPSDPDPDKRERFENRCRHLRSKERKAPTKCFTSTDVRTRVCALLFLTFIGRIGVSMFNGNDTYICRKLFPIDDDELYYDRGASEAVATILLRLASISR